MYKWDFDRWRCHVTTWLAWRSDFNHSFILHTLDVEKLLYLVHFAHPIFPVGNFAEKLWANSLDCYNNLIIYSKACYLSLLLTNGRFLSTEMRAIIYRLISPPKYLKPTPTHNTLSATPSPSPICEFSHLLIKFNEAASEVDDKQIKISP